VLGIAASNASHAHVLLAGIAALVAGAMSMATGEFVSVSSQADTEGAALDEERAELLDDDKAEHRELAAIYVRRGLELPLAREVADRLMAHDALGAHARDELGITELSTARPLQAATASALSFAAGAALPLATVAITPERILVPAIAGGALVALAILGALAARTGGGALVPAVLRVTFWSALAMAVTFGAGYVFGAVGG
jgi:VIT1/CCC1 family predicted Fe2+/Mn2+ transporter